MEQKQPLPLMVLGDLDSYVQKNESRSPTYAIPSAFISPLPARLSSLSPPFSNPVFPVNPNGDFIRRCPFLPFHLGYLVEEPHKLTPHIGAAPCS